MSHNHLARIIDDSCPDLDNRVCLHDITAFGDLDFHYICEHLDGSCHDFIVKRQWTKFDDPG